MRHSILQRTTFANFVSLILILFINFSLATGTTCFFPNGTVDFGSNGTPVVCDPSAAVSMCCGGSRNNCLSNGLCAWYDTNSTDGNDFYRGTCTDQSWSSPICPQHCQSNQDRVTNPNAYDFAGGPVQIWGCQDTGYGRSASYCCESAGEKTRCCSTQAAVFQLAGATVGNPSSPATTTQTLSATGTPSRTLTSSSDGTETSSSAPGSTTAPTQNTSTSASDGATKIGVGVGIPLGLALVGVVACLIWRQKRSAKRLRNLEEQIKQQQQPMISQGREEWYQGPMRHYEPEAASTPIHELGDERSIGSELDGGVVKKPCVELDSAR